MPKKSEAKYIVMATRNGSIKKVDREDFAKVRKSGIIAIGLKGDDELRWRRLGLCEARGLAQPSNADSDEEKGRRPSQRGLNR